MKIAILTSGILPIPAVKGGAVENLIDFYLDYNRRHQLHDITVYSVGDPLTQHHPAYQASLATSSPNHYHYVEIWSLWAKIRKRLYKWTHGKERFHYTIEYFMEQALKDIVKQDYDLVILENRPAYSLKLARRTKAKIVHHLHNDFLHKDIPDAQTIYEQAWRILTVSNYIGSRVKTIKPDGTKCITVNNGIDQTAFSQSNTQGPCRADLGLQSDDFVLVFSGRINAEKGIAELIQAMTLLQDHPDIKLLVMGSSFFGDSHIDDPFITRLKEQASQLGDRIVFTGFIPYSRIPGYLRLADVAVIPSMWDDPFPTSVLEAMCMGMPIITTLRGGIPEEVSPACALLLPTDAEIVNRLQAAILDLYAHEEKRQQMGQEALRLSARFDKDRFAADFFRALEE